MDKPSTVTMDANACIYHAMDLKIERSKITSPFCHVVREFVGNCNREAIEIGTFPKIKELSYENMIEAINDRADEQGIGSYYISYKHHEIGERNLNRLFDCLMIFPAAFSDQEIEAARQFFIKNKKEISGSSIRKKSQIPEKEDLEFLVCSHNLKGAAIVHILSHDSHFTAYAPEIEKSPYTLRIIPMSGLGIIMRSWGWYSPS